MDCRQVFANFARGTVRTCKPDRLTHPTARRACVGPSMPNGGVTRPCRVPGVTIPSHRWPRSGACVPPGEARDFAASSHQSLLRGLLVPQPRPASSSLRRLPPLTCLPIFRSAHIDVCSRGSKRCARGPAGLGRATHTLVCCGARGARAGRASHETDTNPPSFVRLSVVLSIYVGRCLLFRSQMYAL